jgi:hypothetical protein
VDDDLVVQDELAENLGKYIQLRALANLPLYLFVLKREEGGNKPLRVKLLHARYQTLLDMHIKAVQHQAMS